MRVGRPTPVPRWIDPTYGAALVFAGVVVLSAVSGQGAILVGAGLVSYGVCRLTRRGWLNYTAPPRYTPPVVVQGLRAERIVIERERKTRERWAA